MNITFNGEDLTQILSAVNVNRGILPERINNIYTIPKRNGAIYDSYRYKEKRIEVEFVIVADDLNLVRRTLAGILDVAEPAQLIFSDEPNYYWLAIPDGAINLSEVLRVGKGTLSFLCAEPYAFKNTQSEFLLAPGQETFKTYNYGTAPTQPKFTVNFASDCGFIGITSPQGIIQLGNKIAVDAIPVPKSEKLIESLFKGTGSTTWSKNTLQPLHFNAQASGTIYESSTDIKVGNFGTWGTNKEWHGPVLSKGLAVDTLGLNTADNWEVFSKFHCRSYGNDAVRALAMMEFGVFDDTGEYLAGIRMGDSMSVTATVGIGVFVGRNADSNGGERAQMWDVGKYEWFNGSVRITKMGNSFNFEVFNYSTNQIFNKTFYSEELGARKAKTAYLFIGKYKDETGYNDMSVTHFNFTKHHTETMKDIPNIFSNGDELVIDNETGKVTLNGVPYLETLDIGSKFFPINPGVTDIGVIHSPWATQPAFKATFQERYY